MQGGCFHIIASKHIIDGVVFVKSRRFYRRRGTAAFRIICAVLVLLISVLLIDAKLRPAIYDLAALEAYALSAKTVNAAVEETLADNAPKYSELAEISRTDDGRITGITTDVIKLNLFKAQVTKAIDSAFNKKKKTEISVPLGSASGIALFAGIGPYIDVSVGYSSSTHSDFENVFSSAGINQTQHSIMLNIETQVMLSLPGKRLSQTVETSFCVAQTVIVGSVPNVMVE